MQFLSRYGNAVIASGINPDEEAIIYEDLRCTQDNLVLEHPPLHVVYLIAPLQHNVPPDFMYLYKSFENSGKTNPRLYKIMTALGIEEATLFKWTHTLPSREAVAACTMKLRLSKVSATSQSNKETLALSRIKRLWSALVLVEIFTAQAPLPMIANKFKVQVGDLESLQFSAAIISRKIQTFCNELGWNSLEVRNGYKFNFINFGFYH